MTSGPYLRNAFALAAAGLLAGCAQQGPLLSQRTTVGTLKASLSHYEFENERYKNEIAKLKSENIELGNELVQERQANGDITARLDDAKHELRRRGFNFDEERASASRPGNEPPDSATTIPAGQSTRKRRKPPFAQIPGHVDEPASSDSDVDETFEPSPKGSPNSDLGPQSRNDSFDRWLPVARGTTASSKLR